MTDLFDVRLWLYPGANPSYTAEAWEPYFADISAYVRHPGSDGGQRVRYSGGRQDEANQVDAGQMSLTLDNRDGRFSTDKVDGPYYGLLDVNTPIRLVARGFSDSFTRTAVVGGWGTVDAVKGLSWSVSTPADFSTSGTQGRVIIPAANTSRTAEAVGGDLREGDVTVTVIPSAVATGSTYAAGVMMRHNTVSGDHLLTTLEFLTAGTANVVIRSRVTAATTTIATGSAGAYSAGQSWKLRMQVDGDEVRAKAWPSAGSEPTTWQAVAPDPNDIDGAKITLYHARFSGNTNSGAATLLTIDDFVASSFEFSGTVVSWPNDWDITGNNCWASITAAGVLRRLRQGTNPIQSPLRRQLAGTANVTGYWPLEDGTTAAYFTSGIPGQRPASYNAMTPGADNSLPGGGIAPTVAVADGSILAGTNKAAGGTGGSMMFMFKLSSGLPATKTRMARIRMTRGPVAIYDLSLDSVNIYTEGLDSSHTVITSTTNVVPALNWSNWMAWQLETDNTLSPGNTSWSSIIHEVGDTNYYAASSTVSGTTLSNPGSIQTFGPAGCAYGHLWLGQNTLPFVTNSFSLVSSGYAGELAADRFARVCDEAGIPYIVRAADTSEPMGPQREGGTLAILRSCVDADYGVMAERGTGLEFIPRAARWNIAASMTLTKSSGHIAQVPRPVRDDQNLRNRWTVSRSGGGEGVFQDDDSIFLNGVWEDSTSLNVKDDSVLVNQAAWRVAIGTQRAMRWPNIALNFGRNPTLLAGWRARAYGSRLLITTGLTQVTGNEPDLILEGWSVELWPNGWEATLNCSSAAVWKAAVTDDTGILGRVDMDAGQCTTTAAINASQLTIPITTAADYIKWDNTAGLWTGGVAMNVGGEKVTVTSITNGAGQTQTLNCSARGVNGYPAAHAIGTTVSLWDPAVVAL